MTLEEQLLDKLVNTYGDKGRNLQSILDNPLFKDLPLDQKVKFINTYKEKLSQNPSFGWKSIIDGAATGALTGFSTAMFAGAATGKLNPLLLKTTVGLGALGGAGINAYWTNKSHKEDVRTSNTLDDAIQTLIDRSTNRPNPAPATPLPVQYLAALKNFRPNTKV